MVWPFRCIFDRGLLLQSSWQDTFCRQLVQRSCSEISDRDLLQRSWRKEPIPMFFAQSELAESIPMFFAHCLGSSVASSWALILITILRYHILDVPSEEVKTRNFSFANPKSLCKSLIVFGTVCYSGLLSAALFSSILLQLAHQPDATLEACSPTWCYAATCPPT